MFGLSLRRWRSKYGTPSVIALTDALECLVEAREVHDSAPTDESAAVLLEAGRNLARRVKDAAESPLAPQTDIAAAMTVLCHHYGRIAELEGDPKFAWYGAEAAEVLRLLRETNGLGNLIIGSALPAKWLSPLLEQTE